MGLGRLLAWGFAGLLGLVPLNWARLWAIGELPMTSTWQQGLVGTVVCWSIAAALSYFLIVSARGIRIQKAKHAQQAAQEEQALQSLMAGPLVEIRPAQALIKAGEKAYAAVLASLQEEQTVGYSAGTTGMSVRVTKGVTLRTSGSRGHAVKGMVSVASGELVVTDRRVIFAGDKKSIAIPLDDLLNFTGYSDGFGFSDGKTTYTFITHNNRAHRLFDATLNKVLRGR